MALSLGDFTSHTSPRIHLAMSRDIFESYELGREMANSIM